MGERDLSLEEWVEIGAAGTIPSDFIDSTLPDDGAGDLAFGGDGSDFIVLGGGDEATGGAGNDFFIILAERAGGPAVVTDFDDAVDSLSIESAASAPIGAALPVQAGADIAFLNLSGDPMVILRGQDLATFDFSSVAIVEV